MKKKHKSYVKLNIVSLLFIFVSLISVTLAWFAYSGLSKVNTEIPVKAWYIEFKKDNQVVSNDVAISLNDIYPGMDPVTEEVNIENLGDSDAQINYSVLSASILNEDNYSFGESTSSEYIEDVLSHNYPFHIDMNLSKKYALSKSGESNFKVSVTWPLDSGDDQLDSLWGNKAYNFQKSEASKNSENNNYNVKASIKIVISLKAEQYVEDDNTIDIRYNLGDEILFDASNNKKCSSEGGSCLKTHVIDMNNKIGDNTVSLLPEILSTYASGSYYSYDSLLSSITSTWNVNSRKLETTDVLKILSTDINNSILVRDGISNSLIGNLMYNDRSSTELNKAITSSGYYTYKNNMFGLFNSSNCYWLTNDYNSNNAFSFKNINSDTSKIYGENKSVSCRVTPVIVANKSILNK